MVCGQKSPTIRGPNMAQAQLNQIVALEKGVKARAEIPIGRFGKPSEIAAAVLYLASEEAALINGANLLADGGYTIR